MNLPLRFLISILLALLACSVYAYEDADIEARSIVALSPHSVELLFALGAGDRIVATTASADYPEAAKNIPRVGGYNGIQIEQVLALQPDLVVAWDGGNPKSDIDQLERLGLNVYRSPTTKMADIERELIALGKLTGLESRAIELQHKFKADWLALKESNRNKEKVSFFYQLWYEPLRTMAAGSWINEILSTCGGRNIFDDTSLDYPQVSVESIVKAKPQAIFVPSQHGTEVGYSDQWTEWKEIPAVRNNHIFSINGDLVHRFSLRVIDGMKDVCDALDTVRVFSQD
jgi:vitamin B12 transport system substrate-binding protein